MTTLNQRLAEVKSYFDNGDTHVGYRRLLDSAIETQNMEVYRQTLEFCDWYDVFLQNKSAASNLLSEQVNDLLEKISHATSETIAGTTKPKLIATEIGKTYNKGAFKLSPLSLELQASEIIGLVGENGNGKTTLLRLLYGELKPDAGRLSYHLENIPANPSFYDIKTRLAFIPQRPSAWHGSLMHNLKFASTHYGFKGKDNHLWTEIICARMGLRPFRTYSWNRISSGYKMRFELARTLLKKPEVLLLDEPLANLDVLAQQVILEDLRFLAMSKKMPLAVILSSQQLYEVEKVSQKVIFLKEGKARNLNGQKENIQTEPDPLVLELESVASRDKLQQVFTPLGLKNISYNGGVYIIYFTGTTSSSDVIRRLGESDIPVKYFRDISSSSRRFFDA